MYNFNMHAISSKTNNADYSLKQFSELVANVKQRAFRSMSIIMLTKKNILLYDVM
jgi:hypothetical protein